MTKSAAKALSGATASLDDNGAKLQTANSFVTADITGTPKTSPLTVSSVVIALAVPTNAVSVIFYSTANDVRVSEDDAAANYFLLKASTLVAFPCAKQKNIYVVRDAGSDATLQFAFNVV